MITVTEIRGVLIDHLGREYVHRDTGRKFVCYGVGAPNGVETLQLMQVGGDASKSVPWACLYDNFKATGR